MLPQEYTNWVIGNASLITSIESSLRGLFFLLPAGGSGGAGSQDSNKTTILVELGFTAVGLFSWLNDLIFLKKAQTLAPNDKSNRLPHPSTIAISKWISFVKHFELPVEMFALERDFQQKEPKNRNWKIAVFAMELLKVVLRLILLMRIRMRKQGYLLTNQTLPSREEFWRQENVSQQEPKHRSKIQTKRTTLAKPQKEIVLSPSLFDSRTLGELLWIARPLVYLGLIFKHGNKSWIPWMASLFVDVVSHILSSKVDPKEKVNFAEEEELNRRVTLWMLYGLRSPFFDAAKSSSLADRMSKLPLLGGMFSFGGRLLESYCQYYSYISGT